MKARDENCTQWETGHGISAAYSTHGGKFETNRPFVFEYRVADLFCVGRLNWKYFCRNGSVKFSRARDSADRKGA